MKHKSESVGNSKGKELAKYMHETGKLESSSGSNECPREQMIAEAAYFRAERRGFALGYEMSDWFQAEAEVTNKLSSAQ